MVSTQADHLFLDGGFFTLATSVLVWYEYVITFGEEVRCVWGRRISGGSVLFVLNRYASLAAAFALIIEVLPWTTATEGYPNSASNVAVRYNKICTDSTRFVDTCLVLMNVAYTLFAALRMFALYGLKKRVFSVVLAIGVLNTGIRIFVMSIESSGANVWYKPGQIGYTIPWGRNNCHRDIRSGLRAAIDNPSFVIDLLFSTLRIHALIFESMLIGLTWKKTITRWNLQKSVRGTPFTTMLLRDGTLYFAITALMSGLNMFGMILYCFTHGSGDSNNVGRAVLSLTSPLVDALTSICMSRFVLGLLAIALDQGASQAYPTQRSTLHFASIVETIAGNLGADLPDDSTQDDHEMTMEIAAGDSHEVVIDV